MTGRIARVCCAVCVLAGVTMGADAADEPDDLAAIAIPQDAVARERPYPRQGNIVKRVEYYVGNQLVGERLFYRSDRVPQVAEERIYRDGKLHGYVRQWWSGKRGLFAVRPFRDGIRDGRFRFWNKAGELLGESEIKKGTGTLREFRNDQFGTLDAEIPYVNNEIDGIVVTHAQFAAYVCPEGERSEERTRYVAGKKQGWSQITCGQRVVYSACFKDDKLHGVSRVTDMAGRLDERYPKYYVHGKEVTEKAFREAARNDEDLQKSLVAPAAQLPPAGSDNRAQR